VSAPDRNPSSGFLKNFQANSVWRLTSIYILITTVLVALVMLAVYHFSVGQVVRAQERTFSETFLKHQLLSKQLPADEYKLQFTPEFQLSNTLSLTFQWGDASDQIVGRLSRIPSGVTECPVVSKFPIYHARYSDIEILTGCKISADSGEVLIAQNRQQLSRWKSLFLKSSIFTLLGTLLLGGLSGWWFSRKVVRKVTLFNETVDQVEQGDMTARIPMTSRGDEFDQMAERTNRMLSQLEDTFETIRGTTDAIAHDLRTPLNRMRIQLERMVTHPEEMDVERAGGLLAELDGVLATFNSMLELTRLEHGLVPVACESLNLKDLIEDVIELVEPLACEQGQQLTSELLDVQKDVDRNLMFRAIYNLLENAVKYSGPESQISVHLDEKYLVISDTGTGIPEDQVDLAFQRLGRLDSSRTQQGYGLGLSIVKAVIEQHGMSIQLESNQPGLRVVIAL